MTETKDVAPYEGLLTEEHYAALSGPDAERLVAWYPPSADETPNGFAPVGAEAEEACVTAVWLADLKVWLAVHVDGWTVQERWYTVLETRQEVLEMARNAYEDWGSRLNPLHDGASRYEERDWRDGDYDDAEDFYVRPEWEAPEPVGRTLPSIED